MVKDDLPAAQGWQCIDALCCPGDLCDLYIAAEVSPPPYSHLPGFSDTLPARWHPMILRRGVVCVHVCENPSGRTCQGVGHQICQYARSPPCAIKFVYVCVCVCTWQEREGEELGWAALSCLSERSLRHCRTALYRTGLWSARGKLILEKPREVERDWVRLEMLHRSEENV